MTEILDPVRVHIVATDVLSPARRERTASFRTVTAPNIAGADEGAVQLLGASPRRVCARITCSAPAAALGTYFVLAPDAGAAKADQGMRFDGSQVAVLELHTTDEVWVGIGTRPNDPAHWISVVAEYETITG